MLTVPVTGQNRILIFSMASNSGILFAFVQPDDECDVVSPGRRKRRLTMRHFLLSTLVLALLVVGILIPLPAGAVNIVAYDVPVQAGNQGFTGSLGLDFNVVSSITVIGLGVFDSNGDGISTLGALAAQIFNRTSTLAVTVPLTFTNALPGTF